jgi:hypothetical protein
MMFVKGNGKLRGDSEASHEARKGMLMSKLISFTVYGMFLIQAG